MTLLRNAMYMKAYEIRHPVTFKIAPVDDDDDDNDSNNNHTLK